MKQPLSSRLETAVFATFLLTLLWAPLPFASNRPWATALLATLLALVFLFYLLATMTGLARPPRNWWQRSRIPLCLVLAVQLWVCAQLLPLPAAWLASISPQAAAWKLPAEFHTISLDPAATHWYLLKSAIVCLGFMLTILLVNSGQRIKLLLATLVASGTLQATYGSFMVLSGLEWGFFVEKYVNQGQATGTFVNRNHFAGYMALCLSAGIALLITLSSSVDQTSWRERTRRLLLVMLGPGLLLQVCLLAMLIALLLSRSRMGIVATLTALCFAAAIAVCIRSRLAPRLLAAAGVAAVTALLLLGWYALPLLADAGQTPDLSSESRFWSLQYASRMLLDFAWTGSGGGSFYGLFPNYQGAEISSFHRHAHNDYLEFGIELGLPALALLAGFVTWCLRSAIALQSPRSSRLQLGIGCCATMACIWAGLHSLVDFNLQIPANSLTLVTLLALIPAAQRLSTAENSQDSLSKTTH